LARPDTRPDIELTRVARNDSSATFVLTLKREWIIRNQRLLPTLFDADMLLSREDDDP
jgi:hypothetical protein